MYGQWMEVSLQVIGMMERMPTIVIAIAVLWLVLLLWASTILYVFWHSGRQGLAGRRRATWILLSLMPFAGFFLYLWARPAPDGHGRDKRRITLVKRAAAGAPSPGSTNHFEPLPVPPGGAAGRHLPTIAVAGRVGADERADPPTLSPRPAVDPAALAEPAAPAFSVVDGPHAGEQFRLDKLPAVIGRAAGSAVFLENDIGVSRRHAELYRHGRALWLRDLNSRHGTWLNGQRVTETALAAGDTVQVGLSRLLLQVEESG
jgi:hypothetical protein